MRTITPAPFKVYSAAHLKRYYPEGFERAREKHAQSLAEHCYFQDEMMSSLKGLCETAGAKMRDWSIGGYGHCYLSIEFAQDGTAELTGARALAWFENNVLAGFRAPFGLRKLTDKNLYKCGDNGKRGRHYRKVWRRWYAPGSVKCCPFTGVCYDDDLIAEVIKSLRNGDTLEEAFTGLAPYMGYAMEKEFTYQSSPEQFIESADANGWEFTRDGKMI